MSERPEISAVFICVNTNCASRGSDQIADNLEADLGGTGVEVKRIICFSLCTKGPNILAPDGTMYCLDRSQNPNPDPDLDDIFKHILGGPRVDRIADRAKPFRAVISMAKRRIESGLIEVVPPARR